MITAEQYEEVCKNYFDTTMDYDYTIAHNIDDIIVFWTDDYEKTAYVYPNWSLCFYNFGIIDYIIDDIENIGINDTIEWVGAKNFIDIYRQWLPLYRYMNENLEDTEEMHYIDYLEDWFDTHNEGCPVCFNEWLDNESKEN